MKETLKLVTNFDVTNFDKLQFVERNSFSNMKQAIVEYANGYGASIIIDDNSYGGLAGLYEIAVLGKNGEIVYNTPITNDVLGYLSEQEVTETLIKIKNL